jgi:hypothetical protein
MARHVMWLESMGGEHSKTRFENSAPILCVADMQASLQYYVDVLGFRNADWGTDDFTSVNRDRVAGICLCRGGQGSPGTWAWIGVEDVAALYKEWHGARRFVVPLATILGRSKCAWKIRIAACCNSAPSHSLTDRLTNGQTEV